MKTIGQSQSQVDFMNLKTTYQHFLQVIRNMLENDMVLRTQVQQSFQEVNEYIMKQLHRQ